MSSAKSATDYQSVLAKKIHEERVRVLNPAKRYLDGVKSLPPAPVILTQLLALFRDADCDLDQVVKLISHEQSLTAQVLRSSNSAYFAGEKPPADIFEAILRLGFYQVYCLVVSLVAARAKSMAGAGTGVNVDALWRHSVATAVSSSVAADSSEEARAVAFTAGLLHDIGKLVLASVERERYATLIQRAKQEGASLGVLERSAFIVDHAELGGELMSRWNLPSDIVAAVRYHHELEASHPYERLAAAVQVGEIIAHQLLGDDMAATHQLTASTPALEILQINLDDVPALFTSAQGELEKVKGILES